MSRKAGFSAFVLAAALSVLATPCRATEIEGALAHPDCGTMAHFGDGLPSAMQVYFNAWYALADVVLPDLGLQYDAREGVTPALAWPWVIPFGLEIGGERRRHRCHTEVIRGLMPHRVVPEFGVRFAADTSYWLRAGYSFVWHPRPSKVGLALGIGPTLGFGGDSTRGSISPEIGIRYGACCTPLYSALVARYEEHVLGAEGRLVMIKLGLVYF
jgi:hypothetical protein